MASDRETADAGAHPRATDRLFTMAAAVVPLRRSGAVLGGLALATAGLAVTASFVPSPGTVPGVEGRAAVVAAVHVALAGIGFASDARIARWADENPRRAGKMVLTLGLVLLVGANLLPYAAPMLR